MRTEAQKSAGSRVGRDRPCPNKHTPRHEQGGKRSCHEQGEEPEAEKRRAATRYAPGNPRRDTRAAQAAEPAVDPRTSS